MSEPVDSNKRKSVLLIAVIAIAVVVGSGLLIWRIIENTNHENPKVNKPLKRQEIFTDFAVNKFSSEVEYNLLKEIGICDTTKTGDELGACSPKYFRFFKLNANKSLRDGFILLINGLAFQDPEAKFPVRRILIFEREGKELVAVNKFKGNLIEIREVKNSPYKDIVIRFRLDQYQEAYHVVYTWKNNSYKLKQCEELYSYYNKGKVRAELMDSVSREVEKILIEENLVN
jgi:hypothetical protein